MITKTIGGDRLGAGKKMKQSYHNYERSNHDLSYLWRSTIAPGTLVPFLAKPMLPGDTFDIELNTETMTHPTVGPLFGSYKLQLDIFQIPVRLYQAQLHNNKIDIGMNMSNIKLPQLEISANDIDFTADEPVDVQQINPSSLLAYLDLRGLGHTDASVGETGKVTANYNGLKYLMYYDIYKNYYANKQEEIGAYINYDNVPIASITSAQAHDRITGTVADLAATVTNSATILSVDGTNLDPENVAITLRAANGSDTVYPITAILTSVDETEITNSDGSTTNNISGFVQEFVVGQTLLQADVFSQYQSNPVPEIDTFPLSALDDMREDILADIKNTNAFTITSSTYAPYGTNIQSTTGTEGQGGRIKSYFAMQGLCLKTYQSDLFNNWISTEWIDGENGISAITAIDVSDGLLNLDTLNLSQKVYNMLNRISISGGTFYDWIEAVYTEKHFHGVETPVYMGGLSKEIVFQQIVSNSATESEPLGTLAGRGVQSSKHKGGKITVKAKVEPCYVMGIVSLTPRIDYSQGNAWDSHLETMNDFHKPALDGIGYQDLITDQMAAWDTIIDPSDLSKTFRSAGKQPAWINYMTDINRTYGFFADPRNEMFMTLNRRYEIDSDNKTIADLTTYIDPSKFNYIFAQTDRSAQNFWLQIAVGISARRKISARQIPNL